jgi:hypothetical protein
VRDVYLTDDPAVAAVPLDKAIAGCLADEVPEIRSLGNTLKAWRPEILNHHRTGASNGPTEGLNLCVKKVKRAGHGFVCSTITAFECCYMPVESPGRQDQIRRGSERALPTQTRRATLGYAQRRSVCVCGRWLILRLDETWPWAATLRRAFLRLRTAFP